MGEGDGKAKTRIWRLPESCGKKFVDCRIVIFVGANPEPVRFDAAGDQVYVRIRKILDLFAEFRCVSSAGIRGIEHRTIELAAEIDENAAVLVGDFGLKRRLIGELFAQLFCSLGNLLPAVPLCRRVVIGLNGKQVLHDRPWIRQIVSNGFRR